MTNLKFGTPQFKIVFLIQLLEDIKGYSKFIKDLDQTYFTDEMKNLSTAILAEYRLQYNKLLEESQNI